MVKVDITIGGDGRAKEIEFHDATGIVTLDLERYFKKETRYRQSCNGKTISFIVRYVVRENTTSSPACQVRFRPPNEFIVLCHPVEPALDPYAGVKHK